MLNESIIQDYLKKRGENDELLNQIRDELLPQAIKVLTWENKHLGANHNICKPASRCKIDLNLLKKGIELHIICIPTLGEMEEEYCFIPYEKLFSDNWKESLLIIHRERHNGGYHNEKYEFESHSES